MRLLVVANLPERWGRPLTFIDDDGMRFIGLREESLENPLNQVIKRAIDLAVSLPVILFVLPFTTAARLVVPADGSRRGHCFTGRRAPDCRTASSTSSSTAR